MNSGVKDILDALAKLTAAAAVVLVAFVTNNFQSSLTATNLLSQREQADSTLRAAMFRDLIGPVVGSEKSNGNIPADRERLLVELLSLNFHENFELKPIMLHVDDRLAHEEIKEMDQTQRKNARESLRSIARRVLQRQLALLTKAQSDASPEQQACIYRLDIEERPQQQDDGLELLYSLVPEDDPQRPGDRVSGTRAAASAEAAAGDRGPIARAQTTKEVPSPQPCSKLDKYFKDLISINSPNGLYTLAFTIAPFSWEDQSFSVLMRITSKAVDNKSATVSADYNFLLTWFDFPFSDNTLLADGTRFSLVIDKVIPEEKKATLKLVWFPEDYFAARERPTNYHQLREKLGLRLK